MPRDAFVLKIQRELCHPKRLRNFQEAGPCRALIDVASCRQPFEQLFGSWRNRICLKLRLRLQFLVIILSFVGSFSLVTLGGFAPIYFFLATWTYGLYVPSGLFVPCILTGAAWGRLLGVSLRSWFPHGTWGHPGSYALIGAAATLGESRDNSLTRLKGWDEGVCVVKGGAVGARKLPTPCKYELHGIASIFPR